MLKYYYAPKDWTLNDPNPFSENGMYGKNWSCFSTKGEQHSILTQRTASGVNDLLSFTVMLIKLNWSK